MTACYYEHIAQGGGPCFFCIDLNADPEDIPFIDYLLNTANWIDLGAKANLWGGISNETTCMAPNSNKPTRRDFIFAHPDIIPAITNVTVAPPGTFAVHQTITVQFATAIQPIRVLKHKPLPTYAHHRPDDQDDKEWRQTIAKNIAEEYKQNPKQEQQQNVDQRYNHFLRINLKGYEKARFGEDAKHSNHDRIHGKVNIAWETTACTVPQPLQVLATRGQQGLEQHNAETHLRLCAEKQLTRYRTITTAVHMMRRYASYHYHDTPPESTSTQDRFPKFVEAVV